VDTHIFLWAISSPSRLSDHRRAELESPANTVFVSAISIAEIMIKASIGRLSVDFDPVEIATETGCDLLDFSAADALVLGDLPHHHRDPFDRMLIAQSLTGKLHLMSNDKKFRKYDCQLV